MKHLLLPCRQQAVPEAELLTKQDSDHAKYIYFMESDCLQYDIHQLASCEK